MKSQQQLDFSPDFSFVAEEGLRAVLYEYYSQARKALDAGSYLGVIVACGAIVEGLLTWALLQKAEAAMRSPRAFKDKSGQVRPLPEWNLSNLIAVGVELRLIGKVAERASWALMDFRNFIHPYNLLRQTARPHQGLALSSIGAVQEITRSLKRHLK